MNPKSDWWAASGAGSKRNWWVGRYKGNGEGTETADSSDGKLRRFASKQAAQNAADKLNQENENVDPLDALASILRLAESWHSMHHSNPTTQCDEICHWIAKGRIALKPMKERQTLTYENILSRRLAQFEFALIKAEKMRDWFMHTVPNWDKSTEKAIQDFNAARALTKGSKP